MSMGPSKIVAAILVSATLGAGVHAHAQTSTPATAAGSTGTALGLPELLERMARDGYRHIEEAERKSEKLYKVTAWDAQGNKAKMYVDARTAEVLASEEDEED